MAMADNPEKFKRMYKQHMKERNQVKILKRTRAVFTNELRPINPLDRGEPRSSFDGVKIRPTQDTLDVMRGKHR